MAKLIVQPGTAEQADVRLVADQALSIGRSATNDIVVTRRMASRAHALIEYKDGSFFIVDRNSYNGTFVNETPITRLKLSHGDRIRVASYFLRFSETDQGDGEDTLQNVAAVCLDDSRTGTAPGTRLPFELDEPGLHPDDSHILAESTDPFFVLPGQTEDPRSAAARTAPAASTTSAPTPASQPSPVRPPELSPANGAGARTASPQPVTAAERPRSEVGTRSQGLPSPIAQRRLGVALAILVVVAAALLLLWLRVQREVPPAQVPAATTTPIDADLAQLEAALSANPAARTDRLWDFIIAHPQSPLRERAYLGLIDAGGSVNLVCEHAWRSAPELLTVGSPLEQKCPR